MNIILEIGKTMTFDEFRELAAREYLKVALQRSSGSVVRAAKAANMDRGNLHEWLKKLGLADYARGLRASAVDLKHSKLRTSQHVTLAEPSRR